MSLVSNVHTLKVEMPIEEWTASIKHHIENCDSNMYYEVTEIIRLIQVKGALQAA